MCEKPIKPVDPSKVKPVAKSAAKPAAKKEVAKKAADDEFDPFADGSDDDKDAMAEMKKKAEAQKADDKAKAVKKAPIAKSLIVWEVKPYAAETNLDELAAKILAIKMDGLNWKTEYKTEPVAFGVFKLQIGATIEDAKVSTDDVQELVENIKSDEPVVATEDDDDENDEGYMV